MHETNIHIPTETYSAGQLAVVTNIWMPWVQALLETHSLYLLNPGMLQSEGGRSFLSPDDQF